MLGLGLGLNKRNFIRSLAQKLYAIYTARVTAASGVQQNAACDIAALSELGSQGLLNQASFVLVPDGIKEDVVFAQKPTSGLGDLTFTRASDATYTDSTGVIRRSPYNLFQFSEQFENVYWAKTAAGSAAAPIVTANAEIAPDGTTTADRVYFDAVGTSSADRSSLIRDFAFTSGQTYTISGYAKSATGANQILQFRIAGIQVGGELTATNEWQRFSVTHTATTSTTDNFGIQLRGNNTTNKADLYLWGAQLVEGSAALDYFPTTNRQDVPRIDFRNADGSLSTCGRLLLEPQRTNSIRNSSGVGAVAGTPGTLPTNYTLATAGLTQTIVGVGTENGLPYFDIRLAGTATSTQAILTTETTSGIAASAAQSWTTSNYIKIINGTFDSIQLAARFTLSIGGSSTTVSNIFIDSNLSRYSATFTTPANTATIQPRILINLNNGTAYDFTIRIAAPQMELGAYATTFIPTTTAAVTRLADAMIRQITGLTTTTSGTFFVDFERGLNVATTRDAGADGFFYRSGATFPSPNSIEISTELNGSARIETRANGVFTVRYTNNTLNRFKMAVKWDGTTATGFVNGSQVFSAALTFTAVLQYVGYNSEFRKSINESLIFPTPLSDAQCIQLTTL